MNLTAIILFLIIGALAGWFAGLIMGGEGFGLVGNIFVGILGALLGGFLFGLADLQFGGLLGALFTATVGAIILLFFLNLFVEPANERH